MTKEKVKIITLVVAGLILAIITAFTSYEKYYKLTSISGNVYSVEIDEGEVKSTPFSLNVVIGDDEVGINLLPLSLYDAIMKQIEEGDYNEYTKYLGGYSYQCYFDGSYFTYLRPISPGDYISISSTNEEKLNSVCEKIKIH